jgi:hypothetical protein
MSGIYETVRQAILDKHQVIAAYNGHVREMSPCDWDEEWSSTGLVLSIWRYQQFRLASWRGVALHPDRGTPRCRESSRRMAYGTQPFSAADVR